MKKVLILGIILLISLGLTGCNNDESIHIYSRSGLRADGTNINVPNEYTIKDFQREYTEDGLKITINYEILREGGNGKSN